MSDPKVPYGNGAQIFTFGVHGTQNSPAEVHNVAHAIASKLDKTTSGANLYDGNFSWEKHSNLASQANMLDKYNGFGARERGAEDLTKHVLTQVDRALNSGSLDRDKALTINLVGFSHGGNVAMLAADDIAEGLRARGLNSAIHLTTLSTPAYTTGRESPLVAANGVERHGITFRHDHFSVTGDTVIRMAQGNAFYDGPPTINRPQMSAVSESGIANHGAPQNSWPHINEISNLMRARFTELSPPPQRRSDVGSDTLIASATPEIQTSGAQSLEFKNNPRVQEIYAALDRNGENQTPSLVAGLAGAAANLREVRDVVLTPQTAFALNGEKSNPAADRAWVSMDVANKPFDEVWRTASVALQQTQTPAVVAQSQDLEPKKSAPTM